MDARKAYHVKRPIFDEQNFSEVYELPRNRPSATGICRSYIKKNCGLSPSRLLGLLLSFFPCLKWLPKYKWKEDLIKDMAGGLTVGIMQIPQGMAYAMLTSLPPVYGLYVSFIPVLTYFIFGTSKHVSVGTFAIVCLMVGEVVDNKYIDVVLPSKSVQNVSAVNSTSALVVSDMDLEKRVQVAIALSLSVGILQIIMGFAQLGFVTVFLSDPMVSGFTTGAAFHIFSSQVRHFLGIRIPGSKTRGFFTLFKIYIYLIQHILFTNLGALTIGVLCTILLFGIKHLNEKLKGKLKFPIPGELIIVVLGTGVSYGAKLHERYQVPILDTVPKGVPSPSLPSFSVIQMLVIEAFTIAVVAFAINVSLAKSFAKKNNYKIDANQELIAYGLCNVVGSFFSCFPSAVSLSRSLIQESLGSTQVTGVISVVLVVLVLLSMAPLFEPLPKAVLAAIVLVALKGLFKQFKVFYLLWKMNKIDAFIWFSSFLAVFLLGVDYGLAFGIAVTLISTVARTTRPSSCILGQVPGTDIYRNCDRYEVRKLPGIKIFRYDASLYYANVEHFRETLFQSTVDPRQLPTSFQPGKKAVSSPSETDTSDCETEEVRKNGKEITVKVTKGKARNRSKSLTITSNGVSISEERGTPNSTALSDDDSPSHSGNTYAVILDCSLMSYADSMGVSALANIATEYSRVKLSFYLCCCSDSILEVLETGGFTDVHGSNGILLSVHDAVLYAQNKRSQGVFPDPPSLASFTIRSESPSPAKVSTYSDVETKPAEGPLKTISKEV